MGRLISAAEWELTCMASIEMSDEEWLSAVTNCVGSLHLNSIADGSDSRDGEIIALLLFQQC
jgi:hypothetical protein